MSRADVFLTSFAVIEKRLRKAARVGGEVPFSQVVEAVASRDPAVKRFRDDLKEFADLRNAIVHERTDGHPIAEPNSRALREIQRLETLLLDAPEVTRLFQGPVLSVLPTAPIGDAVDLMRRRSFSQLPVQADAKFVGLLSSNTIARWLGSEVDNDLVTLADTTVADVLKHTEELENYHFLQRHAKVFAVLEAFEWYEARGKRLEAILITANGKPGETLLGIATIHDIPRVIRTVSFRDTPPTRGGSSVR